jgi:ABC-2 type transport system ATP-binding protein
MERMERGKNQFLPFLPFPLGRDKKRSMIHISNLTKTYGRTVAVDKINLDVPPGQIIGYLGPNGAGKSTTVKMLVGILKPTDGEASVAGYDVVKDNLELKKHIGYVPESVALYESLTPVEYLRMVGRLYHIQENVIDKKIEALMDLFDIRSTSYQRISGLSRGMQQKILILSALIHNPEVIFLDEPLSHLDVSTVTIMKKVIQNLADEGRTVFYCTHILDVAENICQRILIINKGRIVADGSVEELREMTTRTSLEDIFTQLTDTTDIDSRASEIVRVVMR